MSAPHLVVAGAGPVGVVTALAAANRGFRVTLIEVAQQAEDAPRAATFHPSTLEMIAGLGIMEDFLAVGLVARHFEFWDKPSRTRIAQMDHDLLRDETPFPFVVQTEQHKLVRIALERLALCPDVDVRLGWTVTGVVQDANGVTVSINGDGGNDTVRGDWLAGCDGGRSTVRKVLEVPFEGYTWPERFVVLTTPRDAEVDLGCCLRNYFADPNEWANLFKVAGDDLKGRWRLVFPTRPDESDEEAVSDAVSQARMRRVLPVDEPIELIHRNIYRVHQRVAAKFRVGRVFLAGDAAHVNNPIGGLGLNCGVHDAIELVDTLALVGSRADDEQLLDRYTRRRRELNIQFVQQQTVDNKRRLEEKDPEIRSARLDDLARIAADDDRQRAFLRRTSLLDSVHQSRAIA
jgi:3-(3-hydroxy-phenyl)propionate hydroxylase